MCLLLFASVLTNLRSLQICCSKITDIGISYLKGRGFDYHTPFITICLTSYVVHEAWFTSSTCLLQG